MSKKTGTTSPTATDPGLESGLRDVVDLVKGIGWREFQKRAKKAPRLPLHAEWSEVAGSLNDEKSDRALVIIAAAFLDDVLGELLSRRLANGDKRAFQHAIPEPGLLAKRISLATAVDLIGPGEAADLRTISNIRNRFAHRALGLTFSDPGIVNECGKLNVLKVATTNGKRRNMTSWSARDRFRLAAFALTSHLQILITTVERLPTKKDGDWPFGDPTNHPNRGNDLGDGAPPSGP